MTASPQAVSAVEAVLGCARRHYPNKEWPDSCAEHIEPWTDRGCRVAVLAADAALAAPTQPTPYLNNPTVYWRCPSCGKAPGFHSAWCLGGASSADEVDLSPFYVDEP